MKRRLVGAIGSIFFIALFGGIGIDWLNDYCPDWSHNDCWLSWGALGAAVVGGVFLMEYWFAYTREQKEQQSSGLTLSENMTDNSNWYVTIRPVAWVTLSALLVSLPLCAQGAFILTVSGVISGVFFNMLIRSIFNWLPPEDDTIDI